MWIVFLLILLVVTICIVIFHMPSKLDKVRKEADKIILTRQGTQEDIQKVLSGIFLWGMYEGISDTNNVFQNSIDEGLKESKEFHTAAEGAIRNKLKSSIAFEDEERIKELKLLLKEIKAR